MPPSEPAGPGQWPGQHYVQRFSLDTGWMTLNDSVGNASYARGYFNALSSFYPSPAYRLIGKDGTVVEERSGKSPPRTG